MTRTVETVSSGWGSRFPSREPGNGWRAGPAAQWGDFHSALDNLLFAPPSKRCRPDHGGEELTRSMRQGQITGTHPGARAAPAPLFP